MASQTNQFKAAKQEMQCAFEKAEEEENCQIKETNEAKELSPWLRQFVEPVDEKEEPYLAIMCTAFKWLIQDAQHYAVQDVVGIHTLFEANKKEVEKETNMLFDSWMDITTIEQYVEFQPLYMLTEAQQSAMQTVRDKIGAFQEWKEEQEKSAEGEDCDEDEGFDDGEDKEGVGVYQGAGKEVDEGFEDEMSKETKWMQQIHGDQVGTVDGSSGGVQAEARADLYISEQDDRG
ncbi:hypothetical protein V502_06621 [Pseudogymnoascus sp. VKM F-4520 (FW-2644)]|nr:hypothetical protein V502_06621 [Pseudogymnoascus sp. VKM F-4520 (FW-2644)]